MSATVRVPGDAFVKLDDEGTVVGITFTPHAGSFSHHGSMADLEGVSETDDVVDWERAEAELRLDDVDGPFWKAVQAALAASPGIVWSE